MIEELLKEPDEYGRQKKWIARPYRPGMATEFRQSLSPGLACALACSQTSSQGLAGRQKSARPMTPRCWRGAMALSV